MGEGAAQDDFGRPLEESLSLDCQLVDWLIWREHRPVLAPFPPAPSELPWWKRLLRPSPPVERAPVAAPAVPEWRFTGPGALVAQVEAVPSLPVPTVQDRSAWDLLRTMTIQAVPAARLTAEERNFWKELVLQRFGVSPLSYVFLCCFPLLPEGPQVHTEFDQISLQMSVTITGPVAKAVSHVRLIVLQDLKSGRLVQISQPAA